MVGKDCVDHSRQGLVVASEVRQCDLADCFAEPKVGEIMVGIEASDLPRIILEETRTRNLRWRVSMSLFRWPWYGDNLSPRADNSWNQNWIGR